MKTKKVQAATPKSKPVKRTKKRVAVKVSKRTKNFKTKPIKDPVAYLSCMKDCCQQGIKPKNIAQVAHECKTNALAINKKMSAQKKKDLIELAHKHEEFRKVLGNYVKKY